MKNLLLRACVVALVTLMPAVASAQVRLPVVKNTTGAPVSSGASLIVDSTGAEKGVAGNPVVTAAAAPGADSASGLAPAATSAAVSCHVAKASSGNLSAATLYSSAAGWFLILNATATPSDGAVTPIDFIRYPNPDTTLGYAASPPVYASAGITICFSTTGPYTLTKSATATISAKVK